jgi:hypothetical protein
MTSMQFDKTNTGASPYFNHERNGTIDSGIGADKANGNSGGEIRRDKFANDPLARPAPAATK